MRILVFRMSSLGDLILSTSFLENLPEGTTVDWVVSSDFEFVLRGHPKIRRLISFDKRSGFRGWLRLLGELSVEHYDVRVDLHRTLRTRAGTFYFFVRDLLRGRKVKTVSISKERIQTLLLLVMKGCLPKRWIPTPYWIRFAKVAGLLKEAGSSLKKPSYLPVLENSGLSGDSVLQSMDLAAGTYFCLMPASRWRTKEWSPEAFFELARSFSRKGLVPVLMGREKDASCFRLKELLEEAGIPFRSALREPDFRVSAILLKSARFFVGCDTGLSHLSEAVGCKTHVIFGPTRPEIGFGPCQSGSRAIALPIACAPCSKDGKHCYRFWSPYACMKQLQPEDVERDVGP
jgi:ADP-heptose:LPS heptosyltransferase